MTEETAQKQSAMQPSEPSIYHIVHVDRIASIVQHGCLWSDAKATEEAVAGTTIGMGAIKSRRLTLPVTCHRGDTVGEYVPFYFCPRSVMLFVIHKANNPELVYRGGQRPIVHLVADLHEVVVWAKAERRRWAFSLSNAGAYYTQFRSKLDDLGDVNWDAVSATDFRNPDMRDGKQAEFLVKESFPWSLVKRVGVYDKGIAQVASLAMKDATHRPVVEVRQDWYF